MKVQFFNDLEDRAHYYVSDEDFLEPFSEQVPYGNDARPLRYLGLQEQPGGKFHTFEGSFVELRRVKRIEQDPAQVALMFNDYLATFVSAAGRIAYSHPIARLSDKGSLLQSFNDAMDEKPPAISVAAENLRKLAKLYGNKPVTGLPFVKAITGKDNKKPEIQSVEDLEDRASISVPWVPLIIVTALTALLLGAIDNGK